MRTLIRDVREEAGLSQVKLAKRADVPPSTLTNWEQGRRAPNDLEVDDNKNTPGR